jgi:hypothetical protein
MLGVLKREKGDGEEKWRFLNIFSSTLMEGSKRKFLIFMLKYNLAVQIILMKNLR